MWALIDHHLDIRSPLRAWHPTVKLIGLGSLIIGAACAGDVRTALTALAVSIVAVALTLFSPRLLWRRLRGLVVFIVLFSVLIGLTADGEPMLRWGPLTLSRPGLLLAASLGVKVMSIALLAAALTASTPFAELCHSMRRLGCPDRLMQVIVLSYRMNFALSGELESTHHALSARGFSWGLGRRALVTIGNVIGSLLVRSLDRADRLYDAMLARGYDGTVRRLTGRPAAAWDIIAAGIAVIVTVTIIGMNWWI